MRLSKYKASAFMGVCGAALLVVAMIPGASAKGAMITIVTDKSSYALGNTVYISGSISVKSSQLIEVLIVSQTNSSDYARVYAQSTNEQWTTSWTIPLYFAIGGYTLTAMDLSQKGIASASTTILVS